MSTTSVSEHLAASGRRPRRSGDRTMREPRSRLSSRSGASHPRALARSRDLGRAPRTRASRLDRRAVRAVDQLGAHRDRAVRAAEGRPARGRGRRHARTRTADRTARPAPRPGTNPASRGRAHPGPPQGRTARGEHHGDPATCCAADVTAPRRHRAASVALARLPHPPRRHRAQPLRRSVRTAHCDAGPARRRRHVSRRAAPPRPALRQARAAPPRRSRSAAVQGARR